MSALLHLKCNKYGHRGNDHASDGSVLYGLPSSDTPSKSVNNDVGKNMQGVSCRPNYHSNNKNSDSVLKIGLANLRSGPQRDMLSRAFPSVSHLGPLVDDGAPYSAIVIAERFVLRAAQCLPRLNSFDPVPTKFSHYIY